MQRSNFLLFWRKGEKWIWFCREITLNFLYFEIILKLAAQHGWRQEVNKYLELCRVNVSHIRYHRVNASSDLTGPRAATRPGRAGASFELNNFPGNEMIFLIYLGERRGNRRQLPLYPHYHYPTADWESVCSVSRKFLGLFSTTNLQRLLFHDVCLEVWR